uniref:Uncharacterized protein n=1 Tax=Glossina palpalis gambiensis TaxID=67801 RepID=A0A1B0C0D6_9MUSC
MYIIYDSQCSRKVVIQQHSTTQHNLAQPNSTHSHLTAAAYSISISSIGNNILQKHVSNQQRSPRVGSTTIVTTRKTQTTTRTIIGYSVHKTGKCIYWSIIIVIVVLVVLVVVVVFATA